MVTVCHPPATSTGFFRVKEEEPIRYFDKLAPLRLRVNGVLHFAGPVGDGDWGAHPGDRRIVESATWPGYLETAQGLVCNSPSAAAILMGSSVNGWIGWKTEKGEAPRRPVYRAGAAIG